MHLLEYKYQAPKICSQFLPCDFREARVFSIHTGTSGLQPCSDHSRSKSECPTFLWEPNRCISESLAVNFCSHLLRMFFEYQITWGLDLIVFCRRGSEKYGPKNYEIRRVSIFCILEYVTLLDSIVFRSTNLKKWLGDIFKNFAKCLPNIDIN